VKLKKHKIPEPRSTCNSKCQEW